MIPASKRTRQLVVKCPSCGGPSPYVTNNPWRPFCCQRCKLQDLGAWATEDYRLDAEPATQLAPSADTSGDADQKKH